MTIPLDLAARIERLFTVEHWRVGTIARQLHVHRDTVLRVLREHGAAPPDVPLRASLVDPYRVFIDETLVKYLSYSNRHADMLFELVSRRYLHKSSVVTTNRRFADWGEVFPNAACVVSLVDRLMHRAEVVRIEGDSYRQKEAEERATQRTAAVPPPCSASPCPPASPA